MFRRPSHARLLLPACLAVLAACGDKDDPEDTGEPEAEVIDDDADGFASADDCDDHDSDVNPGATEVCNGIDDDCDGEIDEGLLVTAYLDTDGDGFGDPSTGTEVCEPSELQSLDDTDCNDGDAAIYPGADESCNGKDDDCDEVIDEDDAVDAPEWYFDLDGDGYGDADNTVFACEQPSATVEDSSDCDDTRASVNPGAEELCDAIDTDCDGAVGETLVPTDFASLQEALDAGETEVCLEVGTHAGLTDLGGASGITIEGAGTAEEVILDGEGAGPVLTLASGETDVTLRGFTVTGGTWNDATGEGEGELGAGGVWLADTADVTVEGLVFDDNTCEVSCGAAALGGVANDGTRLLELVVRNHEVSGVDVDTIVGLVTLYQGGDAEVDGLHLYDNVIDLDPENSTSLGTSLSIWGDLTGQVSVNDVLLEGNAYTVETSYGDLAVVQQDSSELSHVRIADTWYGGELLISPLFVYVHETSVEISHAELVGNTIEPTGAIYDIGMLHLSNGGDVNVNNMVVAGNTASSAAVFSAGLFEGGTDGSATYENITIHGNTVSATQFEGGGFTCLDTALTATNVTISANQVSADVDRGGWSVYNDDTDCTFDVTYSNVYDSGTHFHDFLEDWTGTDGNIEVDPAFTDVSSSDPLDWDLTLSSSSSLVDAGDPGIQDADGSTSDIGAYGGPEGDAW